MLRWAGFRPWSRSVAARWGGDRAGPAGAARRAPGRRSRWAAAAAAAKFFGEGLAGLGWLGVQAVAWAPVMGSLIKKRRKRMRKKKHKKMLKRTRFQRRAKK